MNRGYPAQRDGTKKATSARGRGAGEPEFGRDAQCHLISERAAGSPGTGYPAMRAPTGVSCQLSARPAPAPADAWHPEKGRANLPGFGLHGPARY